MHLPAAAAEGSYDAPSRSDPPEKRKYNVRCLPRLSVNVSVPGGGLEVDLIPDALQCRAPAEERASFPPEPALTQ